MLTLITGPPCSGKTTYLRQHARAGDITIDFDELAQVLGSPVPYAHGAAHAAVAMAARQAAITEAVRQIRCGILIWIIDTWLPASRMAVYYAARPDIVRLTAPAGELHRRATAAGRPPQWHQLIDEWVAKDAAARNAPADGIARQW